MTCPCGCFTSHSPFEQLSLVDLQRTGFSKGSFWVCEYRKDISLVTLAVKFPFSQHVASGEGLSRACTTAFMFSWLLQVPGTSLIFFFFFSTGLGTCIWVLLFVSFLQKLLFCPFVIYRISPALAPSPLGFRSQLFLDKRYWISLRCQRFCKVMLDLTFRFAPYVQWITAVQWAQAERSLGQGANLSLSPQADLALPQLPAAAEVGRVRCNSLACYRRWQRWFLGASSMCASCQSSS